MSKLLLLGLAGIFLGACSSSQIIRDSEYKSAEAAFKLAEPQKALEAFPQKEKGGFVTSIEKSWLGFWAGHTHQEDLLRQARTLDARRYLSLHREAEYFFFNESEEGYIPAEHEVIVMHLISSLLFMREGKWDQARVEAKRASYFLESFFSPDQKHFDDPALRVWLAGVWTALGEWNEAQVDLRRAYEISHNKDLLLWLDLKRPPSSLTVVFEGLGPQVEWPFGSPLPQFIQSGDKPPFPLSYPTLPWFLRHQERNSLIRDKISKSNYMSQYYGIQLTKGAARSVGFISANTLRVAGVAIGTAIAVGGLYVAAQIVSTSSGRDSGDLFALPIAAGAYVGKGLWRSGDVVDRSSKATTQKIEEEGKEELKTYRFVRFMPSWISMTDQVVIPGTGKEFLLKSPSSDTAVSFIHKF